ncbi:S-layer homology domain-containing protein [Urinicoccus timonensis]|uniref:S-layer homology domain-containing protein n=1 Tax=Urinicoccus timonensis TaxID=2024205 RepID=UPI000C069480|nr:S-layer homology domain-containing protein [Urinicoccus timonensis]
MKKKKSTALFLALLMIASVFLNGTSVFAENEQEVPGMNQPVEKVQEIKLEDKKGTLEEVKAEEEEKDSEKIEVKEELKKDDGLEISKEEVPEVVGEPATEKTFTVTKRSFGSAGDGELVGEYDTFYEAVNNCKQEDLTNEYVITMNNDYTVPETEAMWGKSNVNMVLKSKEGNQFTLKRSNKNLASLYSGTTLKIENVILDGSNSAQAFGITGGTLTLADRAVVQNFSEYPDFDGPAIYLNGGTLNILEGAIIQNNKYSLQGGAIQARNDSIINISGGTFRNNNAQRGGGAIAAFGPLNVTGGKFEDNETGVTGGAIIIGKNHTASISNATFKGNKASTGGAIYSSKTFSVSKTTFESNEATWGGAIFSSKKLTLDETTFKNNKANSAGGALYLQGGAEIKNSTFTENTADRNGGAIYITKGDSNITNCEFTKNGSQAIFINHENNGTTTISDTTFTENYSNNFGGGIYLGKNSKLIVNGSNFLKNEAAYGAGISSAGTGNVDKEKTNIKVDSSKFTDNLSLMGAGIFTAFPTELTNSTFTKNTAMVHPQDDQKNPHDSGVGGAIEIIDNNTVIKGATFEENMAGGSGGAIGISGVARDEEKNIARIKPNIKVEISENTKFINNNCVKGQGGAIFTIPYLYDIEGYETGVSKDELKEKAYRNLLTSEDTVFKGNVALSGFFNPPVNYDKYTNLAFDRNSFKDVLPNQDVAKSLLNNYDVNFKNVKVTAYFNPNEGKFKDGEKPKDIRVVKEDKDKEITLLDAPNRAGYKFTGWKCSMNIPEEILKGLPEELLENLNEGKIFKAGDKFKLDAEYIFIAQWEKVDLQKPDEPKRPHDGGKSYFMFIPADRPLLNLKDHAQYMIGYKDQTFRPDNQITRQEVAAMFSRLLNERPQKGMIYSRDYKDIPDDLWSATAISYMSKLGLVKGYPDGNFRPFANISRAEFAAMATRFAQLTGGSKTFTDVPKDHWAYESIQRAAEAGWVSGYPDGSFKPDQAISRAEVVAVTNRMLNRFADEDYVNHNPKEIIPYKDMEKAHWAYYPIVEATNGHSYERKANGQDERWFEVNNTSFVYDK